MFCFYILPSFAVNVAVTVHLRRDEIPSNFIDEKCVVLTIQKCHTITRSLFIKRSYIKILPHRTYGLIFSKIILISILVQTFTHVLCQNVIFSKQFC